MPVRGLSQIFLGTFQVFSSSTLHISSSFVLGFILSKKHKSIIHVSPICVVLSPSVHTAQAGFARQHGGLDPIFTPIVQTFSTFPVHSTFLHFLVIMISLKDFLKVLFYLYFQCTLHRQVSLVIKEVWNPFLTHCPPLLSHNCVINCYQLV